MKTLGFFSAAAAAVMALLLAAAAPALAQSVTSAPPTDPTLTRLYDRVDTLEAALREATANAERYQRERDQARAEADRLRKMVDDLNTQLAAAPPPPVVAPPPIGIADAGALFDRGRSQLTTGDWGGAELSFTRFIELGGGDPRLPEATYLKGFSQFQRGAMKEAGQTFVGLVRTFPDERRAGDAWAYLGAVLAAQGARTEACQAFASARAAPRLATDARILVTRESVNAKCPR
jgi:tetratricopeptide (TPR) repeat protein